MCVPQYTPRPQQPISTIPRDQDRGLSDFDPARREQISKWLKEGRKTETNRHRPAVFNLDRVLLMIDGAENLQELVTNRLVEKGLIPQAVYDAAKSSQDQHRFHKLMSGLSLLQVTAVARSVVDKVRSHDPMIQVVAECLQRQYPVFLESESNPWIGRVFADVLLNRSLRAYGGKQIDLTKVVGPDSSFNSTEDCGINLSDLTANEAMLTALMKSAPSLAVCKFTDQIDPKAFSDHGSLTLLPKGTPAPWLVVGQGKLDMPLFAAAENRILFAKASFTEPSKFPTAVLREFFEVVKRVEGRTAEAKARQTAPGEGAKPPKNPVHTMCQLVAEDGRLWNMNQPYGAWAVAIASANKAAA